MLTDRRQFIETAFLGAAASFITSKSRAATGRALGIPGPYPGRVIAVQHTGCIAAGAYQPEPVRNMVERGIKELTGAPTAQDAWRSLFQKGDVVGIKVSPVGGSNALFGRFRAALDLRWSEPGRSFRRQYHCLQSVSGRGSSRLASTNGCAQVCVLRLLRLATTNFQLDMGGYDDKHFMELAIVKEGDDPMNPRSRRSYVAKVVTTDVNKIINVTVLKHHQSAGVTIALKNMSHGFVNNVNRSHMTPTANACGMFIPSVVSLPIIRQKVVLHVVDSVKASYHGGPSAKPQFVWEPKMMYFGTDPVALDKTGWKVIDAKRQEVGMAPIASSKPDKASHYPELPGGTYRDRWNDGSRAV